MKIFIKIFVWSGAPFGIIMGAIKGFSEGIAVGFIEGLLSGFGFGLSMSLILGTLQIIFTWRMPGGGDVGPHQNKTVYLHLSLDAAFERCRAALKMMRAKIKSEDRQRWQIESQTNPSWKSFGEVILLQLHAKNTGQVSVRISSSPMSKWTLVDYGKGYQNVERIAKILVENP